MKTLPCGLLCLVVSLIPKMIQQGNADTIAEPVLDAVRNAIDVETYKQTAEDSALIMPMHQTRIKALIRKAFCEPTDLLGKSWLPEYAIPAFARKDVPLDVALPFDGDGGLTLPVITDNKLKPAVLGLFSADPSDHKALRLNGQIVMTPEQETEKTRFIDGAGISINLNH